MSIFGFVSHWHYPVGILASCPFVCNFSFGLYSDPFQYDLKKHRSCTGDKRNCSVICTQFKITFLGKWAECGERPFLWPLTSYPDRHTYSVHSAHTVFHPALNSSSGTSLGSVALRLAVRRMARATSEWSGVFAALTSCPILCSYFLSNSLPFLIMLHVFTIPLCSFRLELSSHWFDYLEELPGISFWVRSLLPIPRTCPPVPARHTAVYPLWAYSAHQLQFLISVLVFAFCFSLFPDCC